MNNEIRGSIGSRDALSWWDKNKALHQFMFRYHDNEYRSEYDHVTMLIKEASAHYPSSRYISEGYAALFE